MPSSLERIQRLFTASATSAVDPSFIAEVSGGGKLSAAAAVEVYRKGYPARMSAALGETFEACWRVLGDEDFLEACRVYARRVPSASYNLSDYGSSFPEFLLSRFKKDAPFIGDLARLEWSFKELFHAAPHAGLAPGRLSAVVKENSVLTFGSAVALLSATHKVHGLWTRDRDDDSPLKRSDWTGPERILLYKNGGVQVFSRLLTAAEAAALRLLREGRPLDEALSAAKGLDAEGVRSLFSFIAKAGLITEVR